MIRVILFLLLSSNCVFAQPWGLDHLGGGKYPEVIRAAHPRGFAAGVFTQKELFADGLPAAKAAIEAGAPLIRYNLRWSDSHSFPRSDWPKIVQEAKRVAAFAVKYPGVRCAVSGATEHQLSARDAADLARQVLAVLPAHCDYVNNPWEGRGAFLPPAPRVINEVHGIHAQPPKVGGRFFFSFDGSDCFDVDVTAIKSRMRNAEVAFYWTSQSNGRRNAADSTPRPLRKFWPTERLLKAMAFLSTNQGRVSLPKNYLVKPKSDQHTVPPAPRELKPVLIFPNAGRRITVHGNGRTFNSATGEPFADGRTRYYFPQFYGYEIMNLAGTNVLEVRNEKGKALGTVNLGFRQGGFR